MPQFDESQVSIAQHFSDELRRGIEQATLPGLGDGPANAELQSLLNAPAKCCGPDGRPIASLLRAGLWLLAGDLDRSHTISQDEPSREGSFWHGIMHRREGDYANAAYWFRRVGNHPVLESLAEIHSDEYADPYDFNDAVAKACRNRDEAASDRLRQIQWTEWQLLTQHCVTK